MDWNNATNTQIEEYHIPEIAGAGEIWFEIRSLNLIEGNYLLDLAVHSRDYQKVYNYHSQLYSLTMKTDRKDEGIFRPDHSWTREVKIL